MKPEQIKALLIEKLSTYYDGAIHSSVDLSMRDEIADKGKELKFLLNIKETTLFNYWHKILNYI